MRKKTMILPLSVAMFLALVIFGLKCIDDFFEWLPVVSFLFWGLLISNFYCLKWKDSLILNFVLEKKLDFLFVLLAVIYLAVLIISFIKTDGLDRIMHFAVWTSVINVCLCNFVYARFY